MTKIFLASIDIHSKYLLPLFNRLNQLYFNLFSFYYLNSPKAKENYLKVTNKSINTLVDSGAHSFQKGTKVNYDKFLKEYINFIEKTDNPKCLGYFELDVDNIIGYDKVLEYRQELEEVSNKIIPVWHKNRGIKDFKEMCREYNYVSISGWKNEDIFDNQFKLFVNYAHHHHSKIHGLGLTRFKVLKSVPFDSVDSSSWTQMLRFRNIDGKYISKEYANTQKHSFEQLCYSKWMKIQREYATPMELQS